MKRLSIPCHRILSGMEPEVTAFHVYVLMYEYIISYCILRLDMAAA